MKRVGDDDLVVSNTGETYPDLLKAMDRGFLVSELMGHGVNSVTGDYSRGTKAGAMPPPTETLITDLVDRRTNEPAYRPPKR